jgi:hypothetical protein
MNTQVSTTRFKKEVSAVVADLGSRTKCISAVDVWNIQRNKRSRVQRRFAL